MEENRKAIENEQEEKGGPLEFIDAENYENMISGIENFKKSHKKAAIIIFDKENRELTKPKTITKVVPSRFYSKNMI